MWVYSNTKSGSQSSPMSSNCGLQNMFSCKVQFANTNAVFEGLQKRHAQIKLEFVCGASCLLSIVSGIRTTNSRAKSGRSTFSIFAKLFVVTWCRVSEGAMQGCA